MQTESHEIAKAEAPEKAFDASAPMLRQLSVDELGAVAGGAFPFIQCGWIGGAGLGVA